MPHYGNYSIPSMNYIQQRNNNRWEDDDHNDDNNSDKFIIDAWRTWKNSGDKKDDGDGKNHDRGNWKNNEDKKDDGGWDNSKQSWTNEWPKKASWEGSWQWSQNYSWQASAKTGEKVAALDPDDPWAKCDPHHPWKNQN